MSYAIAAIMLFRAATIYLSCAVFDDMLDYLRR